MLRLFTPASSPKAAPVMRVQYYKLLSDLSLPATLSEIRVREELFDTMADDAMASGNFKNASAFVSTQLRLMKFHT